ncbi:MAG: hypothetical protein KF696_01660 [Planctomycetes bacterium]|nr:hypothetical protein [Planctomycetota bacterium]MCW8134682.1 hypothetical protein [Planctomycetota bacterium]
MSTFAEVLDLLWQLQALDVASIAAREKIAREETRANHSERAVEALMVKRAEADAGYKRLEVKHRELEAELKRLDGRIRQIESVPGSEEAVAKHRESIDKLEMDGIALLGEIDASKAGVAQLASDIEAQRRIADMERAGAKATRAEQQAIIDANRLARDQLSARVPEDALKVYESAAQRHPGSALARVSTDFCAVCSGELNMHLIMRAKARTEFVRCPHCARILDPAAA